MEIQISFGQRDSCHRAQFRVHPQQKSDIFVHGDAEGIGFVWSSPLRDHGFFRGKSYIVLFDARRSPRDLDRMCCRCFDGAAVQLSGCSESPSPVGNHPHAHSHGFCVGCAADLAVFRGQRPASLRYNARVGVARSAQRSHIQSPFRDLSHGKNLNLPHRLRTRFALP